MATVFVMLISERPGEARPIEKGASLRECVGDREESGVGVAAVAMNDHLYDEGKALFSIFVLSTLNHLL